MGSKVIDRLVKDLRSAFPDMSGLSRTTSFICARSPRHSRRKAIVHRLLDKYSVGHNVRLLELVKDQEERLWYIRAAIQHGWGRNVLVLQI